MRKTRKPQRTRPSRKTVRRRKKTTETEISTSVIDLDQFYKIANRVQVARETVDFVVKNEDIDMIENLLKDLELPFEKRPEKKICTKYTVSPGKERLIEDDTDNLDNFPDEIAEDGQVFF